MRARPAFGELAVVGTAVGGSSVWALAAAARVGVLRLLLDAFPRATWDAVTWGLIPALLLAPCAVQGLVLAGLGGRGPRAAWAAVFASAGGTLAAMAVFGFAILDGVRRLPPRMVAIVTKVAPNVLIPAFAILVIAGWVLFAARIVGKRALGLAAFPFAVAAVGLAWWGVHGRVVALSYVLGGPEANGFFAAVAVGGAVGAAWAARPAGTARAGTGREAA